MIQTSFPFDIVEKIKSLENSNDIADQIMGRSDDYSLGIPRPNLGLKHMSITCSCNNMLVMWS